MSVSEFKQYRRTQVAEMRPVTILDIQSYRELGTIYVNSSKILRVSISDSDKTNGSPMIGDMIARNPKNHTDQWLVAQKYFEDNFTEL